MQAVSPELAITSTRIFSFPIEQVYEAWTNPDLLKQWWGPAGFTNTFHEFDLRPGGQWRFTMHGPEKGNYENHCEFIAIEKPVLLHWKRYSQPLFQVLVNFDRVSNEETSVRFRMLFDTAEECEKLKKFVVDKNEENFDKLEKVLQLLNS